MNPNTGFKNVAPRTRYERRAVLDKESLEKSRLAERREGHQRFQADYKVTGDTEGAPGFITEADRFYTDTAGMEKMKRDVDLQSKQQNYMNKRSQATDREDKRWRQIEESKKVDEERWDQLREDGSKARRNNSSVPYNPLTLHYNDGKDGDRLRWQDDDIKYRAALRADNLNKHDTAGYNPINGENSYQINVPPQPEPMTDYNLQQDGRFRNHNMK